MKGKKLLLMSGLLSLALVVACGGGGGDGDGDDAWNNNGGMGDNMNDNMNNNAPMQPPPTNPPPTQPPTNPPSGSTVSFSGDVYPILQSRCQVCHSSTGTAKNTRFIVSDVANTYNSVVRLVNTANPPDSDLLEKATNSSPHGGGQVIAPGSNEYNTILQWIQQGANNN